MLAGKVFLDASVLNLIIDYAEEIFDGYSEIDGVNDRLQSDIYAMYQILMLGQRNGLDVIISPTTFDEILNTKDEAKREKLYQYCSELWQYFHELMAQEVAISEIEIKLIKEYLDAKCFSLLPGENDKRLIIEALFYKCEYFCTRDWKTILKHRDKLGKIPIKFITPSEWFEIPK
jgi:predicted nucleic acid-binding protein